MTVEQARNEHQQISKAFVENDTVFLLLEYACLDNARQRLLKLEHFLNYGEWK